MTKDGFDGQYHFIGQPPYRKDCVYDLSWRVSAGEGLNAIVEFCRGQKHHRKEKQVHYLTEAEHLCKSTVGALLEESEEDEGDDEDAAADVVGTSVPAADGPHLHHFQPNANGDLEGSEAAEAAEAGAEGAAESQVIPRCPAQKV